ncbi:hypothetical protein D3C81_1352930 [compost metagenome]
MEQRLVARRAVQLWRHGEQAGRQLGRLQAHQDAPGLQGLRQAGDAVLAHLVAAGATQQQRHQVALLGAEALGMACQRVAHGNAVKLAALRQLVDLVQLQPEALRHGAVELAGAGQRAIQAVQRSLQGDGENLGALAIAARVRRLLDDDQLVADGQMVLQSLAEVGDLARALIQNDGLAEEVPLQVLAHEMDFRAHQLQQLQAVFAGGRQLVQLHQGLIELARGFAEVGLRQVRDPALQFARRGTTEGQALFARRGNAQQQVRALVVHPDPVLRRLVYCLDRIFQHSISISARWQPIHGRAVDVLAVSDRRVLPS